MTRHERRTLVAHSTIRMALSAILLFGLYAVVPVAGESGAAAAGELAVGLIVFLAVVGWLLRSVLRAEHPELRALEALAIAFTVVIIVFAFTYLSLWEARHTSFSEPLDRASSVYFTVSVLGTVGFGDIVARTDATRIIVTIQILIDLVLLAAVVRALLLAARTGVRQRTSERTSEATASTSDATNGES